MQAEKFPHDAFYSVAPHRVAAFSRYRESKTPLTGARVIRCHKKNKMPRKVALPRIVTVKKIRPPHKAVRTGKRKRAFVHVPARSGRKALASLGAPAPQHGLPAGSTHARAKTVTSFSFDPAGLIGSFHSPSPSENHRNPLPQACTRVNTFLSRSSTSGRTIPPHRPAACRPGQAPP